MGFLVRTFAYSFGTDAEIACEQFLKARIFHMGFLVRTFAYSFGTDSEVSM